LFGYYDNFYGLKALALHSLAPPRLLIIPILSDATCAQSSLCSIVVVMSNPQPCDRGEKPPGSIVHNKVKSSLLVQILTGAIGLQSFLFKRRVSGVTTPYYECGEGRETNVVLGPTVSSNVEES